MAVHVSSASARFAAALGACAGQSYVEFSCNPSDSSARTPLAGSHPSVSLVTRFSDVDPIDDPGGRVRDITYHLPPGLVGNPQAAPSCSMREFNAVPPTSEASSPTWQPCPSGARVGAVEIRANSRIEGDRVLHHGDALGYLTGEVYLLTPEKGEPGVLGVFINPGEARAGLRVVAPLVLRAGTDPGLDATITDMPSEVHRSGVRTIHAAVYEMTLSLDGILPSGRPFMRVPTSCAGATATLDAVSADGQSSRAAAVLLPRNCEADPFSPQVTLGLEHTRAAEPSGLEVTVDMDQRDRIVAPADLARVRFALPEGLVFNPGVANGLALCSDAEFAEQDSSAARCPAASAVGTVSVSSPLLSGALAGRVFLGPVTLGRYPLFVEAVSGLTRVKLRGEVTLDETTGQVRAQFDDMPQLPISKLRLVFRGGERAVLANPSDCGKQVGRAAFSPWSMAPAFSAGTVDRPVSVTVLQGPGGGACGARPFSPKVDVRVTPERAGASPHLRIDVRRPDGTKDLRGFSVSMPDGLVGRLGAVPQCSNADVARVACPAAAAVGSVKLGVGSGASPVSLSGRVFLTDPVRAEDPAGLAIVLPAKAGPIELGAPVVIRARLTLATQPSLRMSVVTDGIPRFLHGVPLPIQSMTVEIDRDNFLANPTGCGPQAFQVALLAHDGTAAASRVPFRATGCAGLGFAPALKLGISGSPSAGDKPGVHVEITAARGSSGMRSAKVVLPAQLGIDLRAISHTCDLARAQVGSCPGNTIVGTAAARSPLLSRPLRGPVVLVTQPGAALPKLYVRLAGQITLGLLGSVTPGATGTTTVFPTLPDVPLDSFSFDLFGGERGTLTAASDLCGHTLVLRGAFTSQDGRASSASASKIMARCAPKALRITGVRLSKRRLHRESGRRGRGMLSYRLSGPASVRVTIERRLPGFKSQGACRAKRSPGQTPRRCFRYARVANLRATAGVGRNRVPYSVRRHGRLLPRGRYRVRVTGRAQAGSARPVVVARTFSVVR